MHHQFAVVGAAQRGSRRAAHRGHQGLDVGVGAEHFGDALLIIHHLVVRSALRGFGDGVDLIGILIRE